MAQWEFFDTPLLRTRWIGRVPPFGVIDVDRAPLIDFEIHRPPFPLIGTGRVDAPLSRHMDVLIEAPFRLSSLLTSICERPKTAAIAVQLLRAIEDLDEQRALVLESMAYGLLQSGSEHRNWLGTAAHNPVPEEGRLWVERHDGLLDLVLDRPEALNAVNTTLRDHLRDAFDLAALDPDVTQVRLTGRGRAFCIGADLSEFGTTRDGVEAHAIRQATLPAASIARVGAKLEVRVEGACVGAGLEMAAFAGRLVASRRAWFQLPELAMGLIPGAGGCVSVAKRIGRQRTALMILSGRRIDAETALRWGLVDELTGNPGAQNVVPRQA